jgi:cytochrome c553
MGFTAFSAQNEGLECSKTVNWLYEPDLKIDAMTQAIENAMTISNQTIFRKSHLLSAAVAVFISTLLSAAQAETPGEKDAKYGKAPAATCIGCHGIEGYKASFPNIYSVPKISGQSQKYLENALQAYRKGERSHPTMKAIAGALTDADITALAAYYSKNTASGAVAAK